MSAIGKIFESIMNSRLKHTNKILEIHHGNQFGFKVNSRTIDNMFILSSLIERQKLRRNTCIHAMSISQRHLTI